MKEFKINANEAGQRFDKYLAKRLKNAPKSFLYKMLRKKNITLNSHKANGNEILADGDKVCFYFSDDTFSKFEGKNEISYAKKNLHIIYENEHVLLIDKPAGILSQPDGSKAASMVEYIIGYLVDSGKLTQEELKTFHPSVCNRLDRNTSGILAAGKSLAGLQELSLLFRERTLHKEYLCLVKGKITDTRHISGYLYKDSSVNKVFVSKKAVTDAQPVETVYHPVADNGKMTLLKVELLTGRTHQIRAHLAAEGHPLLGDHKYGDPAFNEYGKNNYNLQSQLLHAYRLSFPKLTGKLKDLSEKEFTAPVPGLFLEILKKEQLEESYHEIMG